jgi:GT2 family glycosyltransferase/glycosyltransferase involved in cell wall biosynthesis/SAM-dependent methyltransferase
MNLLDREKTKWNHYYKNLSSDEAQELREFSIEFASWIDGLLPPGRVKCLEAGCGAGFQSAALAQFERVEPHLLDFSEEALRCASDLFANRGLKGAFHQGDLHHFKPTLESFDLVFNVGVLEHYPFEDQVELLQSMAGLSGNLVAAVVPNARCYWYWVSRIRHASHGLWPFGVEVPSSSLSDVFAAAGLEVVREAYLGRQLTNSFVKALPELDPDIKTLLVDLHERRFFPDDQACYLHAIVGAKSGSAKTEFPRQLPSDSTLALASDSVAALVAMRSHEKFLEGRIETLAAETVELRERSGNERIAAAELAIREDSARRERDELRNRQNALIESLDGLKAELQQAREALLVEQALRRVSVQGYVQELEEHRTALQRLQVEHDALAQKAGSLEMELEDARKEVMGQRAAVQYLTGAIRNHRRVYNSALRDYSQQRAWRLMVTIRKAYAHWHKPGLANKAGALASLILNPFAKEGTHAEYEIALPASEHYIEMKEQASHRATEALRPPIQESPEQDLPLPRCYDIIIFAIIDYDFRYQRPQQLAAQFAERGHRVFWISPTRFLAPGSAQEYEIQSLRPRLWEVHLRSRQPDIYMGELEPAPLESINSSLRKLRQDFAIAECAAIVQLPFWRKAAAAFCDETPALLCYDCMDDWDSFQNMGDFNRKEEALLLRESDVVFVSARNLQDKCARLNVPALLVRNAVDFDFFTQPSEDIEIEGASRPVVGYYGAIADWIDLDLVCEVAALRPGYTFVLIGQVFGRDTSRLEKLPNVRLLGHKPYELLPAYLRQFDVCHIPFLLNDVTFATDPVKLYEYLSLGKPVVSTDLPELAYCRDLVLVASAASEYAEAIDQALKLRGPEDVRRRQEFALKNTWQLRAADMDGAISSSLPKVSVIIVTHNSDRYISPCLASLRRNLTYPNLEVIIVDNDSSDQTSELVTRHRESWNQLTFVPQSTNHSFACANNEGVRRASGDYVVLLNPDTIVTPGWCGRLLSCLLREQGAGLVSAVTNFAGNEVKIDFDYDSEEAMELFAARLARAKHRQSLPVRVAPLFCSLIRRDLYLEVGGLDEQYEIGMFEDDDFAMKIRERGLRVLAAEDCFVHHFGQASFSGLGNSKYEEVFARNQKKFERKWNQKWQAHQLRPGVKPPLEDRRFQPEAFATIYSAS